jgi:murein DD-endopeptidase MepM/ murein hydrolase activator NlpD
VVAYTVFSKVRVAAGAFAAAFALLGSAPAFANSSANADISAPLRAAQAAKAASIAPSGGDEQFRKLFTSWQSLEKSSAFAGAAASTATPKVSIPSLIPVAGVRLSSGFGMRNHPVLGGRRGHNGVDLAGATGTPIRAPADGVVGKAEWFSSYGLYIQMEHGAEIQTRYAHMSRLNVAAGQFVKKGDVIGYIGSTGRSTGPHLHYEVRIAGQAVDPTPYMQEDIAPSSGTVTQLAMADGRD